MDHHQELYELNQQNEEAEHHQWELEQQEQEELAKYAEYLEQQEQQGQEEVEKRLLKLLREEVENFGLTPHIRRILEDEEYAAKQGGDKPDVSVEEFDNFMNGGNDE
mgnify:FL=1